MRVEGGRVGGGWATRGINLKEGTCDEHLYVSGESLNSILETNITLYVN